MSLLILFNTAYISYVSKLSANKIHFIVLFNTLNAELNTIYHLLALLGLHHILHISRMRVKSLTLRLLMSYIYIYIYIYIYDISNLRVKDKKTKDPSVCFGS
jgi:hypothetical protein